MADQGNDRDSACSKEYSLGKTGPRLDQAAATLAGRQVRGCTHGQAYHLRVKCHLTCGPCIGASTEECQIGTIKDFGNRKLGCVGWCSGACQCMQGCTMCMVALAA